MERMAPQREADEVVAWRARRLRRAGFAPADARRVAADGVIDLHALIALTERGCPPALAIRILTPLETPGAP